MANPIIAEVTRGPIVESRHRGAFAVANANGNLVSSAGDISSSIYPRSAIKAFQCLPLIESGAAKSLGLTDKEIALCCSSHNGEADHVRVARSILAKAEVAEECYECGAHLPTGRDAAHHLIREGLPSLQVHNNCSGKHAGMLALAKFLGAPLKDYVKPDHTIQLGVAKTLTNYFGLSTDQVPMGIDGCSVPNWAFPLANMATGFAKLCDAKNEAGQWIIRAARAHPFMIGGSARFDTKIMEAVPSLFIKVGGEAVFCGCIPHAGLGFALKCDDGAYRGAEVAVAGMLSKLDVWSDEEKSALLGFASEPQANWRKIRYGDVVSRV